MEWQYSNFIERWKKGEEIGLQTIGTVSPHIKKFLRGKYGNACQICGWREKNPVTGKVPLVADHIDGNWRNNIESNLRPLCPNCDSLSPTYAGLNRGKGRPNRKSSKRAKEAREMNQN